MAIRQVDNLVVKQAAPTNLTIHQPADELVIIDQTSTISGNSPIADEITAQAQTDNIIIVKPAPDSIIIRD